MAADPATSATGSILDDRVPDNSWIRTTYYKDTTSAVTSVISGDFVTDYCRRRTFAGDPAAAGRRTSYI